MTTVESVDLSEAVDSLSGVVGRRSTMPDFEDLRKRSSRVPLEVSPEFLLESFSGFLKSDDEAFYISTPITTGLSHLDDSSKERAREINRERAEELTARMRVKLSPAVVINPTPLVDIRGWVQSEYHNFWASVIARYAKSVIFVDGWQFSAGCSVEYVAAVASHLPTLDEDLVEFDVMAGVRRLDSSIGQLTADAKGYGTIVQSRAELDSIIASQGGN